MAFHTILTHEGPHLDEITAIWLLRRFGEKKFPGIGTAKVVYTGAGGGIPGGQTPEECERDGVLCIGVGGGRFDEHPTTDGGRKQDECAATLVAGAIGVAGDPALGRILKYVVKNDLKGVGQPFDLAYLVKALHQQYSDNPEKVMEWAITGLEVKYNEQSSFVSAGEEFRRTAKVEEILGPGGKTFKMAVITSDNGQMNKFARSEAGGQAAIIIQKRSSGNVQIYTNKHFGLTLYDVAQMLRFAEQRKKGAVLTDDWRELAAEGKVEGAEEWFYHHGGQMLLNGSLTASDVPPTQLPLEQIKGIVRIGVNPGAFCPERASGCERGFCSSTRGNQCLWYEWGLHRCRTIRYEMKRR